MANTITHLDLTAISRKVNEIYSKHLGLFINTYHESRKEAVQLRTQILSLRLHL